jgi:hypothetical protein
MPGLYFVRDDGRAERIRLGFQHDLQGFRRKPMQELRKLKIVFYPTHDS